MSANEYTPVQLAYRHVPEEFGGPFSDMREAQNAGHDTLNPTTGIVQLGILVEGGFAPLWEDSAGRFFHLVETAKANAPQQEQPSDQPQPSDQGQPSQ